MPNGVRARGNSRHANRQRNAQRDMAVRAELVQEAPAIVIEAEPISVQADPDTIQQLQRRIAELEEQVKQVKRNYKSAKKQADGGDHIITNMTHYFRNLSQEIGMTTADILSPGWLDNFKSEIIELKDERDTARLLEVANKVLADTATKERDTAEEKYQKAINGTLLAFQETEIQDLQDENDKLRKLNKTLLNRSVEHKDEMESLLEINANLVEDFANVINKLGSKRVHINQVHISTAKCLENYMTDRDDMACVSGLNRGLVIQGKKLIDTDKDNIYEYDPETKKIYDDDDGEYLGKLITKNGKLAIKWV